jgi:GDP-4-dehydro-6-deoxy-D-mannose reductase
VIGRGLPDTLSIGAFVSQLNRIRKGEIVPEIAVGNLRPRRDFVDIRDVCNALIALATHGVSGEVYNVCSGTSISMESLLRELISRTGLDVQVIADPSRIKSADIEDIYGSNQKIRSLTGWERAFSLSDSVASMIVEKM